MKKYFAIITVLCGLTISGIANAANGQNYPVGPYYNNYTPEQWAEAQRIFEESNAGMATVRQELASKREILDRELAQPNPDPRTIEKLSREIGELRGKMLAARVNARNRLAERGLPADCYGPCNRGYYGGGWSHYYNDHRPRHHRRHDYYGPMGPMGPMGYWR